MKMIEQIARAIAEENDAGNVDLIWAETVHAGDCTKEPFSCAVCCQDEHRALARAALEELLALMKGPGQAEVRAILDEE